MRTVLWITNDALGQGDRELGQKILCTFLRKAIGIDGLEAIAFANHGVRLLAHGSPALPELAMLYERGVELLPCSTCLRHLGVEPVVGRSSDMDAIVAALSRADKVIPLA